MGPEEIHEVVIVEISVSDTKFEIELCAQRQHTPRKLAVCTKPLYDVWSRPEALLHFVEYHANVLNASLLLYDLDGSLDFVKNSLPQQTEVFGHWADMLAPPFVEVSRGKYVQAVPFVDCTLPIAEAHCLFQQRSRAEWVYFADAPDNYLTVLPRGGPNALAEVLDRVSRQTAAIHLFAADFGGPKEGNGILYNLPPYALYLHRRKYTVETEGLSPWALNRSKHLAPWSLLCRPSLCISKHSSSIRVRAPFGTELLIRPFSV